MARKNNYRGIFKPKLFRKGMNVNPVQPRIDDVETAFERIQCQSYPRLEFDGKIVHGRRYTPHIRNLFGLDNHIQGVQRLTSGDVFLLSGGDPHQPMAHLFIVEVSLPAESGDGGVAREEAMPLVSRARILELDDTLWHAGGLAQFGNLIATPVYNKRPNYKFLPLPWRKWPVRSHILFFDFSDPKSPGKLPITIEREGFNSFAAALTRDRDQYFWLAVWSSDHKRFRKIRRGGKRLDFFRSKTPDILDGFEAQPTSWYPERLKFQTEKTKKFADYQSLDFIRQEDGRLFLVGMHNTARLAPTISGRDIADLYEVKLPRFVRDRTDDSSLEVTFIKEKKFESSPRQFNMDGGVGVHVTHDGKLAIYSAHHWRYSNQFWRLAEFLSASGNNHNGSFTRHDILEKQPA